MEERLYDRSALNPKGTPENKNLCIADVMDFSGWHLLQCSRKRGFGLDGLYCKQHAKNHPAPPPKGQDGGNQEKSKCVK